MLAVYHPHKNIIRKKIFADVNDQKRLQGGVIDSEKVYEKAFQSSREWHTGVAQGMLQAKR